MNKDERICKEHQVLTCLCSLPRRILSLYESNNVTEFVLHDLCNENCFNWHKAAYFVDNPDFDCLKGIAGCSKAEAFVAVKSIWDDPTAFSIHMEASPFNQQVRHWNCESCKRSNKADSGVIKKIADELGFQSYCYYGWDIKYGNHGILIYELEDNEAECLSDECIQNGISFLGLCPIV